jgi:hypothetical protein
MMFKKLNQYLLTKYPLLWNTRVLQVLAANAIIHILFFLGGYASLSEGSSMKRYAYEFYSPGLIMFSVLCSFVVMVLWLVFYLRNNAFKSFYTIGRWHLIKEMLIVMLIVFTSICFFESYNAGFRAKGRSITPSSQMLKEANTINLAMAFIPYSKSDYFILRTCDKDADGKMASFYDYENLDTINTMMAARDTASDEFDANNNGLDSIGIVKRNALRKPGAISYLHYCKTLITLEDAAGFVDNQQLKATVNRWVKNHHADSVKYILDECLKVCKKYAVDLSLNTAQLAALPFDDSMHTVNNLVKVNRYDGENFDSNAYISIYELQQSMEFAESCQAGKGKYLAKHLMPSLYVMLFIGIVIICYRRFSKKTFFISLVGAIVWVIFFGLLGAASASADVVGVLFLFLFVLFSIVGFAQLKNKSQKTLTGVFLNWHIYTLPIVLPAIAGIITANYGHLSNYRYLADSMIDYCKLYPFSCWVSMHFEEIAWGNLVLSLLYYLFVVNRITKKWHVMPDE